VTQIWAIPDQTRQKCSNSIKIIEIEPHLRKQYKILANHTKYVQIQASLSKSNKISANTTKSEQI
jgi:hypothetical protein